MKNKPRKRISKREVLIEKITEIYHQNENANRLFIDLANRVTANSISMKEMLTSAKTQIDKISKDVETLNSFCCEVIVKVDRYINLVVSNNEKQQVDNENLTSKINELIENVLKIIKDVNTLKIEQNNSENRFIEEIRNYSIRTEEKIRENIEKLVIEQHNINKENITQINDRFVQTEKRSNEISEKISIFEKGRLEDKKILKEIDENINKSNDVFTHLIQKRKIDNKKTEKIQLELSRLTTTIPETINEIGRINNEIEAINLKQEYQKFKNKEELKKRDYKFNKYISVLQREQAIIDWYYERTREVLDLDNPKTFNEKIQWLKLYNATAKKQELSDKYLVKEWVAGKIGEKYIISNLGVWGKFSEIDFDKLPDSFVLKCNHGSGWNRIIKKKSEMDYHVEKEKFDYWIQQNYAFCQGFEMQYYNIDPKIIAEELLETSNGTLDDYKVWCFDGSPELISYYRNRQTNLEMAFFDQKWEKQEFTSGHKLISDDISRPEKLEEMLEISRILSKGFPFVRVDLYILKNGDIKFGEMTFTSGSGVAKWNPKQYDLILGDMIKLPSKLEEE